MSIEDRIRKLAEDIVSCQDDGKTALLTEELLDAIRQRVRDLRAKNGAIPLGPHSELFN